METITVSAVLRCWDDIISYWWCYDTFSKLCSHTRFIYTVLHVHVLMNRNCSYYPIKTVVFCIYSLTKKFFLISICLYDFCFKVNSTYFFLQIFIWTLLQIWTAKISFVVFIKLSQLWLHFRFAAYQLLRTPINPRPLSLKVQKIIRSKLG